MKISGENPETGEVFESESESLTESFFDEMSKFQMSDEQIRRMIDRLNVSADIKSLLYTLSKATIKAGEFLCRRH